MIDYKPGDYTWRTACNLKGSVIPRCMLTALPAALISIVLVYFEDEMLEVRNSVGLSQMKVTIIWSALSAPLFTMIGFRTSEAMRRFWEGTGLLHAMRGEWFDSASCLVTFSMPATKSKPELVADFRHTMLRLMSLCHGSALDELKTTETEDYEVLDIRGLDDETIGILRQCKEHNFNRVEVLLHMIQVLVINAQADGILNIPPPILSRVYQTLSRGFVNLLNAKKIKDTRFPFPHAQIIAIMLIALALFTPLAMTAMISHTGWCALATFFPLFALFTLNYTAEELEMPFGEDPNDLPLKLFQEEMNTSLLMLIHNFSDHVAKIDGERALRDFAGLATSLHDARNSLTRFKNDDAAGRHGRQSIFVHAHNASKFKTQSKDFSSKDFSQSQEPNSARDPREIDLCSQWSTEELDQTCAADEAANEAPHFAVVNGNRHGALEGLFATRGSQGSQGKSRRGVLRAASQPALGRSSDSPHLGGSSTNGLRTVHTGEDIPAHSNSLGIPAAGDAGVVKQSMDFPPRSGGASPTHRGPEMTRPGNSGWAKQLLEAPPAAGFPQHGQQHQQPSDLPVYFDIKL
mmetsp:Transcript_92625/g.178680  ORF Transcript_92625/g.178680 Transcript_92625/m.178680 type:complete len:576 (-) Transcript_92625:46-1773(-)